MQYRDEDLKERPLGELVRRLSEQTSTLVRQELDLARAELTQKGKRASRGVGLLAGAGVAALLGLGALTACLILLLDAVMPAWLAALLVALAYAAIAAALAASGRSRLREAGPIVPERTVETVKEDLQWARTRTPSDAR